MTIDENNLLDAATITAANNFLDALIVILQLKNDAALSRALGIVPASLSRVRHGKWPIGPSLLVKASELTGLNVQELKMLMGGSESLSSMKWKIRFAQALNICVNKNHRS